ncbi:uncharacterized protein METZ01_LOCUS204974 [marine metagenome]|uniref:Uncharacterized protein n=1 Tax=marine metagenome TaxID=408172 RepID=A0A382EN24_9ZZZZ
MIYQQPWLFSFHKIENYFDFFFTLVNIHFVQVF